MTLTFGKLINEYRHNNQARRTLALIPVPIIRRDGRLNTKQKAAKCTIISFACAQAIFDVDFTNAYMLTSRIRTLTNFMGSPSEVPTSSCHGTKTTLSKSIFEKILTECAVYIALLKSVKQKKVVEDDGVSENEYDENLGEESGAKIILESTFLYMKTAGDHRYRYGRQALVI